VWAALYFVPAQNRAIYRMTQLRELNGERLNDPPQEVLGTPLVSLSIRPKRFG